jgi:hypothetical protein
VEGGLLFIGTTCPWAKSENWNLMPSLTINELPLHSPWPARLLGLTEWAPCEKTPQEVTREYEDEKWGSLLAQVRSSNGRVTLEDVNRWFLGETPVQFQCLDGSYELMTATAAYQRHVDGVSTILQPWRDAPMVVELGAGYGGVVLNLAQRPEFAHAKFFAGEYTANGVELIGLLSQAEGVKVQCGRCDFSRVPVCDFQFPEGALVYTSYATPYVRHLQPSFISELSSHRPKAVVHIEPCLEHCDPGTLAGLMRRRYIEVNGYNVNLVSLLRQQERAGLIQILEERPAVMGINPLLAVSVVSWAPRSAIS